MPIHAGGVFATEEHLCILGWYLLNYRFHLLGPGMNFGANFVYVCALTCYNISLSCHRVNRIGYWTCVYSGVSDLSVCRGGIFPSCMHPPPYIYFDLI